MTQNKRFYSLVVNGTEAQLDIYGDIESETWYGNDSSMSAYKLSKQLELLEGVTTIYVNINSYGGEVAEGIAIYNALRRHPAKIVTRCDGMACSIASVIFMAGDVRQMYKSSMLMIHNASTYAWGDAAELRKIADDAEKITSMSKAAYLEHVSITDQELTALMDAETWIDPTEAVEWGFATEIVELDNATNPSQSARDSLLQIVKAAIQAKSDDEDTKTDTDTTDEDDETDDSDDVSDDDANDVSDDDAETDDTDDKDDEDKDKDDKASQRLNSLIMQAFKLERLYL